MIDFANTCRVEPVTVAGEDAAMWAEADDGYLHGLRSLIAVLEDILRGPDVVDDNEAVGSPALGDPALLALHTTEAGAASASPATRALADTSTLALPSPTASL